MWSFFSRDPTKDFAYEIGEPIPYDSERLLWKIHKGKKKSSGEEVTIFIVDTKIASVSELETIRTGVKRLKTLRHPSILTFLDSVESEKALYMATESVVPLQLHLTSKRSSLKTDLSMAWGLFQVSRALSFLLNDGNLRHNNVHSDSVFVNAAGEWKLGGVEFVGNDSCFSKQPICLSELDPPEIKKGGPPSKHKWSADSWGLGVLIWEVYNGKKRSLDLTNKENIPKSLSSIYTDLTQENSERRPNPADIMVRGRKPGGFFKNDLVDSLLFLEEIQIKEQVDKNRFFNGLTLVLDKFPEEICKNKILPQLINAFEFGNAGSAVLAPLFKLGKLLDEPDYQAKIVPCVVKLFSSSDRATRVRLLQQLDNFADHLQPGTVNDQIFPNIVTGFMDTNPTVREQTVKAMLHLAPKLNNNNLNVELLKHFARLQIRDDQGGIRTNTTICLGKIACHLNPATRRKVLIPAFTRVFQDVFPQAKIAGIIALAATQQYYLIQEVASKILPALCPLTCDPDKSVREHAFKTVKGFLGKLEKVSENPALREKYEADIDSSSDAGPGSSNWASWAVSTLTSKFNRSLSTQSLPNKSGIGLNNMGSSGHRNVLGHQSSSSTTTTSSSIPSTPSIDRDVLQPTAEGQESTTDYDEDWDNWGAIEEETNESLSTTTNSNEKPDDKNASDGWDNEDFLPLEEQEGQNSSTDVSNDNTWSWSQDEWSNSTGTNSNTASTTIGVNSSGGSISKQEEMRKRREERRLQRQQEMETKKSSRGPMKLGAKKIDLLD